LATLLYSRLAHKEATGNSAYFLEGRPHITIFFCFVNLQKNRCMRKELKSSDLCLQLKSAAITIGLANIVPNDVRSILSTIY